MKTAPAVAAALVTALLCAGLCRAQQPPDRGDIGRLRYDYQRSISENTRAFSVASYEALLSPGDALEQRQKASLRGGISYNAREWLRLEAGLGTYYSWRDTADDIFEVRLWQAATFDWPEVRALARWVVHHRFMLEERFQHTDGWKGSLRGRYRLSFKVPINRYTVEPGTLYLPMEAELFWNAEDEVSERFSNRNRVTTGLGYQFSKDWATELRYTWQESRSQANDDFTLDDNVIELRIKSTIRILDYLKAR